MRKTMNNFNLPNFHSSVKVSQVPLTERSVTRLRVRLPNIESDQENSSSNLTKSFSNLKLSVPVKVLKIKNIQLFEKLEPPLKKLNVATKHRGSQIKLKKVDKPYQTFSNYEIASPFNSFKQLGKLLEDIRSKSSKKVSNKETLSNK
jgi:hypothetical protein